MKKINQKHYCLYGCVLLFVIIIVTACSDNGSRSNTSQNNEAISVAENDNFEISYTGQDGSTVTLQVYSDGTADLNQNDWEGTWTKKSYHNKQYYEIRVQQRKVVGPGGVVFYAPKECYVFCYYRDEKVVRSTPGATIQTEMPATERPL